MFDLVGRQDKGSGKVDGYLCQSRPLFTKRMDVLPQYLMKSRSHEIGWFNYRIDLKFDRHLGSAAVEVSVKFQSDW